MTTTPSSAPAAAAVEQAPATNYDLASHFLVSHPGLDPQGYLAMLPQLIQAYGPEAVMAAAQNFARVTEEMRWKAYAAVATAQRQPIPPVPPFLQQPNPFPTPNFASAAAAIDAFNRQRQASA